MRLVLRFAIALCLGLPTAGSAARQQDAPAPEQTPAAPAPKENAPAEPVPVQWEPKSPDTAAVPTKKNAVPTGRNKKRRKRTTPGAGGGPRKIVVREGGANEPTAQIVPGISPVEASRQRQNAEQLLDATERQLKPLAEHRLDPQQQEALGQIRNYMDGARSALKEGDVRRASTLAEKARLLVEDLGTR